MRAPSVYVYPVRAPLDAPRKAGRLINRGAAHAMMFMCVRVTLSGIVGFNIRTP